MGKLESFQWLSPIEFSFGEMEDYLYQVAQNHSDLVKVSVEGLTEEGRPIYLLKIGGRGGDNEDPLTSASTATIFIDAGRRLQLLLHLGLYRTSRPVRKSGKFSKSGLSGNWTFSLPDARLLTLLKIEKKKSKFYFF